jgi:ABC-type antimicrobial peptide transport system permease subunit
MDEVRSESIGMQRVQATLLAVFSGLALLLAAAGVYGVLANVVTSRRRELGIRLALGATRAEAIFKVTGDALRLIVVGLLVGIPLALLSATALRGVIFGVEPVDPPTLIAVAALLIASGLAASVLPALRVARLDPAETLRDD